MATLRLSGAAAGAIACALGMSGAASASPHIDPAASILSLRPLGPAPATQPAVPPTTAPQAPMKPALKLEFAASERFDLGKLSDGGIAGDTRERAVECLAAAIFYEAGNQSVAGKQAVAQVVLNRVKRPGYPKTVCGVVFQGSRRATGCQFSFTCDGSLRRRPGGPGWRDAQSVAQAVLDGSNSSPVGNATNYHADYVHPYWSASLIRVTQIGAHIFYRPAMSNGAAPGRDLSHLRATYAMATSAAPAASSDPEPAIGAFRPWGLSLAAAARSEPLSGW